jgi:hypothetical protein
VDRENGGEEVGLRLAASAALAAALAACLAAPAAAATVTAQVQAKVIKPLTIESRQDLDLGTIVLGPGNWSGAVVKLSQNGNLTCPADVTCAGATKVAIYNLTGSNGEIAALNVPNVTMVNQLDSSQTLTLVPDNNPTVQFTNSGNPGKDVDIGGSVTLNSTTAGGTYVGTFNVTADYQ